jgi:photosynthetic reaction center cytochrome c subunit
MKTGRSLRGVSFALGAIVVVVIASVWRPDGLIARSPAPALDAPGRASGRARATGTDRAPAQETVQKVPSAGDAYMNVQVLKDIPSDQLIPAMRYITVALGAECNFCHDPKSFESDDKQEKGTARNMMKMMFAINKDNFNGRREVTCYTCHRGASKAANIPSLYAAAMAAGAGAAMPPAGGAPAAQPSGAAGGGASSTASMPRVDEILAKYTEGLGGAAAVQKITTLDAKGTIELPFNGGMKAQAEMLRKAPDKAVVVVHLPNGAEFAQGYNGTGGWQQQPDHGVDDLKGDDLVRAKEGAAFIPGLNLKQGFSRAQVAAIDKIGDREAYRVVAFRSGGGQVRFYFDTQSGLLLRVSERIESPLGALPQDTDFSDYREVNGVKAPFTVTEARVQGPTTFKWEQIQANTTIDDARFDKPAQKPAKP